MIPPLLMGSVSYWLIGLIPEVSNFFIFLGILVLFNLAAGGLCIFIGTIFTSIGMANVCATICILVGSLFGGFLLNKDLPKYLIWLNYISFWNYALEALFINEFLGEKVLINPKGMPAYHVFIYFFNFLIFFFFNFFF
jgi:ABC-type multidrug transport system permease subunit